MRKLLMPVTGILVSPYSVTAPLAGSGVYLVVHITREGGRAVFTKGRREELALALLLGSVPIWLRHRWVALRPITQWVLVSATP